MTRPFEGIRVIDVTHVLAGPFAAYQLAVLGADVIKVEHPDDPDQSRSSGTDKALNAATWDRLPDAGVEQRSLALDLKKEEDRDILKKLVATADVFVETIGSAPSMRWARHQALSAINPRRPTPRSPRSASTGRAPGNRLRRRDPGHLGHHGDDRHGGGEPGEIRLAGDRLRHRHDRRLRVSAALFQRERTGRGQRIDMAMLDVAMILMSSHVTGYLRNGVHPKPHGNRHPHATNGAFATKDGW